MNINAIRFAYYELFAFVTASPQQNRAGQTSSSKPAIVLTLCSSIILCYLKMVLTIVLYVAILEAHAGRASVAWTAQLRLSHASSSKTLCLTCLSYIIAHVHQLNTYNLDLQLDEFKNL